MNGGDSMEQKGLSRWLKFITLCFGLFGIVIYVFVVPYFGNDLAQSYPEFSYAFYPWVIFLWLTAIPCYMVLVFMWRISAKIGRDCSFCRDNATDLKRIAVITIADTIFFFVTNVVFLFIGISHPSIVLASTVFTFLGIAFAVISGALSHLVLKAAKLQEENELTI